VGRQTCTSLAPAQGRKLLLHQPCNLLSESCGKLDGCSLKGRTNGILKQLPLPRFQPLPVTRQPQPFHYADWLFELKHDGFPSLAYVEHGRCRLVSRNDNELHSFQSRNAAIADELKEHSVVLDGEIVCIDSKGKPQFYDLKLFEKERESIPDFHWQACALACESV